MARWLTCGRSSSKKGVIFNSTRIRSSFRAKSMDNKEKFWSVSFTEFHATINLMNSYPARAKDCPTQSVVSSTGTGWFGQQGSTYPFPCESAINSWKWFTKISRTSNDDNAASSLHRGNEPRGNRETWRKISVIGGTGSSRSFWSCSRASAMEPGVSILQNRGLVLWRQILKQQMNIAVHFLWFTRILSNLCSLFLRQIQIISKGFTPNNFKLFSRTKRVDWRTNNRSLSFWLPIIWCFSYRREKVLHTS